MLCVYVGHGQKQKKNNMSRNMLILMENWRKIKCKHTLREIRGKWHNIRACVCVCAFTNDVWKEGILYIYL